MYYLIFLFIAIVPCVIYVWVIWMEVPGFADERLGVLEDLPDNIGKWTRDEESEKAKAAEQEGLIYETRLWIYGNNPFTNQPKIYRQFRYLDSETEEFVRADKDKRYKRKRVKQ